MKVKLTAFFTLGFACCLLVSTARAQATRIEFSGTQTPTEVVAEPEIRILGNGNIHTRGYFLTTLLETDNLPPIQILLEINANYDATFSGPAWGSWWSFDADTLEPVGEGSYTATNTFDAQAMLWHGEVKIVGHYFAGPLAGGLMKAEETLDLPTPIWAPGAGDALIEGYILMPAGKQ